MHAMNSLDSLYFDDELPLDHDVETERVADRLAAILDREAPFLLEFESREQQFDYERVTIGRFQEPSLQPPMNFNRAADDSSTKSLQVLNICFHDRYPRHDVRQLLCLVTDLLTSCDALRAMTAAPKRLST